MSPSLKKVPACIAQPRLQLLVLFCCSPGRRIGVPSNPYARHIVFDTFLFWISFATASPHNFGSLLNCLAAIFSRSRLVFPPPQMIVCFLRFRFKRGFRTFVCFASHPQLPTVLVGYAVLVSIYRLIIRVPPFPFRGQPFHDENAYPEFLGPPGCFPPVSCPFCRCGRVRR